MRRQSILCLVVLGITIAVNASPHGMVWVYIDDPGVSAHEGFNGFMSKYETTNAQYCEFLNAALATGDITVGADNIVYGANGSNIGTDYVNEVYFYTFEHYMYCQITYIAGVFSVRSRDAYDMSNHPVVEVSRYGAMAFCNYYGYRLPTEWEWQAVADYDGSYTYGCGTIIDHNKANYEDYNPLGLSEPPHTSPVDYYSSYGYGMNDMAGNVREWTSSIDYGVIFWYIFRGGGWTDSRSHCRVSDRRATHSADYYTGFRVAFVPDPARPIHNVTEDTYHETIQDAVDDANERDTIEVLPDTYTGPGNCDIDFKGKAITVRSTDPNDPNIVGATIIDCNGTAEEPHRGFYFHSGEDANSILEGFTITNGYGPNEPFGASEYSAGGAVCCNNSSPIIRNCVIRNNYSAYWGGGLHCDGSYAVIEKCTFRGNQSADTGGGLYNRVSSITVANCRFINNSAAYGGAMYNIDGTSTVKNTLFVGNSAAIAGGALRNKRVTSRIANCTFFDNQAPAGAAVHNVLSEGTTITNCILWGNPDTEIEGDAEVSYCDVQAGCPGEGNIDADPCFADPNSGDYRLLPDSPCIDAGNPNYAPAEGETDFDGQPRILNGRVDIGAAEYSISYVSADSPNDPGSGTQADPYRCIQYAIDKRAIEIRVAQAQYNESISITLNVELFGGYDSDAWGLARDPAANETIIHGSAENENVISVVDASVTIDGFTIENGSQGHHSDGVAYGGIYCASNDETVFTVKISNNIIQNNVVYVDNYGAEGWGYSNRGYGGGIYCGRYIEPVIVDNIIRNNKITFHAGIADAVGGAGIYCAGSRCKILGNVVVDNQIESYDGGDGHARCEGGGIRVGGGVVSQNTVLRNNVFSGGHYGEGRVAGGGIYSDGPAIITRNVVTGNHLLTMSSEVSGGTEEASGGGIYAPASQITFNIINGNKCQSGGGSAYYSPSAASGVAYGGGIFAPSGTLTGNLVMANEAAGTGGVGCPGWEAGDSSLGGDGIAMGGGIYAPSATLSRNLVAHNRAAGEAGYGYLGPESEDYAVGGDGIARGGGIYAPVATLLNNTVADNRAAATPGQGYVYPGHPDHDPNLDGISIFEGAGIYGGDRISNTIIWANSPDDLAGIDCNNVTYCDIGTGLCTGQISNISVDPCFADTDTNDYHPKSQAGRWDPNTESWVIDDVTSPCVDVGDPMTPIGHEPFPNGGIINMGAYGGTAEASKSYFGREVCETIVDGDINGDCRIDGKDLELMVFHWLENIPASPPPCDTIVAGDVNGDCRVDFRDFMIMALHWCEDNNP